MFKRFFFESNGTKSHVRHRPRNFGRLGFETLEDRRLLATFTVINNSDGPVVMAGDLPGSLRQAIFDANALPGADVIAFDSSVFTGNDESLIRLTDGELNITESLTISAPSSLDVTITGDANGDDITLAGNITDVSASFGGTAGAADDLLDDNSRVLNFDTNTGDLMLEGLSITGGRTTGTNERNDNGIGFETTYNGGGIRSLRNITLTNSTVTGNSTAGNRTDGGGIFASNLTLTESTVSGNTASRNGGGIHSPSATLTNSTVSRNSAGGNGGGISSGSATLSDSTVSGNSADFNGGGIFSSYAATLFNSTVSGNIATRDGGGIYVRSSVTLTNSTLAGNTALGSGGAILLYAGTATLTNSTISGNSATGQFAEGGGIHVYYPAAMIIVPNNEITAHNSIISGNSANGVDRNFGGSFDAFFENSIIGGDFTTVLETEVVNGVTVPKLTNNGGAVETVALRVNSPAIDAGDNALAVAANGDPLLTDQRGPSFDRVVSGTVDIGAFEFNPPAFLLGDVNQDQTVNFLDISPFISLLSSRDFLDQADIDRNGAVNFLDISPFINILSGGSSNSSSLSALSQLIVSPPATPLLASESVESQNTAASKESRQISDGISIELVATSHLSIEPNDVVATKPEVLFEKASLQPSESLSEPPQQVSDAISVALVAAPASSTLPTSAVEVTDLIASPSEHSLLAFIGAGEVQGPGDFGNSQNEIPVLANDLAKLASTKDHAFALARQESTSDSDRPDASLLDGDFEFAISKSSANAFDAHPDLLKGLAAAQLDEVFEELLI